MNKIMERLQEYYNIVADRGHEIVGVFLQGSQNYQLDYEGSNIDCKAVVLPKLNDFILGNKMVGTTLVLDNNEHIDLKDLRLMIECFRKQNINFVEILFTKFKIVNPKYEEFWQILVDNNEKIAHYNNYSSLKCIVGMALEKHKALEHPYPATKDKIDKYGYDGKQLSHQLRLLEFMERYIFGEKYSDCLVSKRKDFLINIKRNKEYSLEEARIVSNETMSKISSIKSKYFNNNPVIINKEVEELFNKVLLDIIRYSLEDEILGNVGWC